MTRRVGIVAAGGESRRTGLGEFTTKAAFPLRGRSLLSHQVDFLRRSGASSAYVVARPDHARLLGRVLSVEDRAFVAFVFSDRSTGWAGEVERVLPFLGEDDEVVLVSCDNDHAGRVAVFLGSERSAVFTFTRWSRGDQSPTDGTVLARVRTAWGSPEGVQWSERGGEGFVGEFFSGYAVVRGGLLASAVRGLPWVDGKKDLAALLSVLSKHPGFEAVPYGSVYEDVGDLRALALLNAGRSSQSDEPVEIGAGVLLYDREGRVFLTERQDGLGWCPPSGIVEEGESLVRAAVREVREEVGVSVEGRDLRLLGVYPSLGKRGEAACTVVFHARMSEEAERDLANGELRLDDREVRSVRLYLPPLPPRLSIPFCLRRAIEDFFAGREIDVRERS